MKTFTLTLFLCLIVFINNAQSVKYDGPNLPQKVSNLDILKYWNKSTPEELQLYEAAYKVLSSKKQATFKDLVSDEKFMKQCKKNNVSILGGPILGDISSTGISVRVRSLKPSKIEVEIIHPKKKINVKPAFSRFGTDLTATVKLTKLKPFTSYKYKLVINDTIEITDENFSFKTLPSEKDNSKVRVAFGSCFHRWGLGNEKMFNTIIERNAAAMLVLGDIAVQDKDNNIGLHRADYLLRDFQHGWSNFACTVPVFATRDDHDYFKNDRAGIPEGYTNEDRENVWRTFKNSWNNPSYGFGDEGKGVFMKTRIGPADIIMTDNRYFRTGEKGSFLGDAQMDWLKEELLNCKGPFIILSCGTMWSDYITEGKDSWGSDDPEGREELFTFIEENNISGVLLISGDRHGARGFTIPRESGYEFYEFEAASLGGRAAGKSPETDPVNWPTQLYGKHGVYAFGGFTFNSSKERPEVTFRLVQEGGEIIFEKTLTQDDLTPNKNQ